MLSSWPHGHCASSLGSFDECRTAPSGRRPSDQATWLGLSPPVGCYRVQPPSPFIIITQPESWYSFTVPRRVEGWVDLGNAGRVHIACAEGCKSQWFLRSTQLPMAWFDPRTSRTAGRYATVTPLRPCHHTCWRLHGVRGGVLPAGPSVSMTPAVCGRSRTRTPWSPWARLRRGRYRTDPTSSSTAPDRFDDMAPCWLFTSPDIIVIFYWCCRCLWSAGKEPGCILEWFL